MRKPYSVWTVGDNEYKLKLTTSAACKLEQRLGVNLMKIFNFSDDVPLPPLTTMLAIVHASIVKFHSGIKVEDVQDLFDDYVDFGGDQMALLTDVVMPILENSGFIPKEKNRVVESQTEVEASKDI